jgi:hypothetical protein
MPRGYSGPVIKPSKIRRQPAAVRPSRIRRDPLLVQGPAKKVEPPSPERDIWLGIAGVVVFAISVVTVTVGFSVITGHDDGAAAVRASAERFGSCDGGPDCVIDGDTIRIAGETLDIAGMVAPELRSAQCPEEKQRGVEAVQRLTAFLNSGKAATAGEVRGPDGAQRTRVEVDGRDVGAAMVKAGVAWEPASSPHDWCAT